MTLKYCLIVFNNKYTREFILNRDPKRNGSPNTSFH